MNPTQVKGNEIHGFAAGTWGGEFHPEFGPRDGDAVLEHWAQSGFANTDLDAQLTAGDREDHPGRRRGEHVHRRHRPLRHGGYHVSLVRDATAAFDHEGMHAAHEVNGPRFAHALLTTEEPLALLPADARREQSGSPQRR
jgi:nicotinamidase-related amidase